MFLEGFVIRIECLLMEWKFGRLNRMLEFLLVDVELIMLQKREAVTGYQYSQDLAYLYEIWFCCRR